ncbi:GH1 family beta-glucosidase [Leifsonia sp. NPDC058230]|uniref:GH1 family beta-glucosidase n=1 Tax=Leifsonia sp. NPDC058230 TaxID=3346391 RepID=UPI0036DB9430
MKRSDFPSDFAWGTATAAYQIEGSTTADGRGPSVWDSFVRIPGAIADGSTGEVADDHYRRWPEDLELMSGLGVNAYRFSISWTRIQPDGTGPADRRGLDFYRRLAEACLARGIAPWVTLYHWDLPQALEDRGGWLNRDTSERFRDYAGEVYTALGDVVTDWITLNEPHAAAFAGYSGGVHAPGLRLGDGAAARAGHHLLLGHGLALRTARELLPASARVGITLDIWPMRPASSAPEDVAAARLVDGGQNRFFLDPVLGGGYDPEVIAAFGESDWFNALPSEDAALISAPVDFAGMNYYGARSVSAARPDLIEAEGDQPGGELARFVDDGAPKTQMGWPIHPEGLVEGLRMFHELAPDLPLYVTENGSAWPDELVDGAVDDVDRERYLFDHLSACRDAVAEGIPLKGYFAWTLLDNFEWQFGFSRRFGLFHVDYETQQRTIKRSGRAYARLLGGSAGA